MEIEKSKAFTNLKVWQKAHKFVLASYKYTSEFPKNEMYGLTSQFRRAAVSIPANIVEGYAKKGKADKMRFMNISQGSIEECKYYLILSKDLEYGENRALVSQLIEVSKMLTAYIKSIKNNDDK